MFPCYFQDVAELTEVEATEAVSPQGRKALKILCPSKTRWLILADCLERILAQYDALSAHFTIGYEKERCYMAKLLRDMYKDEKNR